MAINFNPDHHQRNFSSFLRSFRFSTRQSAYMPSRIDFNGEIIFASPSTSSGKGEENPSLSCAPNGNYLSRFLVAERFILSFFGFAEWKLICGISFAFMRCLFFLFLARRHNVFSMRNLDEFLSPHIAPSGVKQSDCSVVIIQDMLLLRSSFCKWKNID